MPWKEINVMDQKERFIQEMLTKEKPFKQLCAEYGIIEKTGYKWKNHFYEQGKAGFYDRSRTSLTQNEIDSDTAAELIRLKTAHMALRPKKIRELYYNPNKTTPSVSNVKRILDKVGMVKPRKIRPVAKMDCPRLQQQLPAQKPNDIWCIDIKGWWKSDGEICEHFTVRDNYSRKKLCAR